jgi:hypothetical protein
MCLHTHRDALRLAELRKNRPSDGRLCVPNGRSQKLPNEPLKGHYPTFFSSLSNHSLMRVSCSISASWCSQNSLM